MTSVSFSPFTGQSYTYEKDNGPQTNLECHQLLGLVKKSDLKITESNRQQLPSKEQLAHAYVVARLLYARPSQTIRDWQRKANHLSPFVVSLVVAPSLHADQTGALDRIQQSAQQCPRGVSVLDRDDCLFCPGDMFIREPDDDGALFELWRCSRLFERSRTGRRCQVWGKKLQAEDEEGVSFVLKQHTQEGMVLLGSIFLEFLVPVSETGLAAAGTTESGDLRFKLNSEWHARIIERVEGFEAGPIEEVVEEEEMDPGLLREQARLRRERDFNFVAANLQRAQRTNRSVRHSIYDWAQAAFAGHIPNSSAGF